MVEIGHWKLPPCRTLGLRVSDLESNVATAVHADRPENVSSRGRGAEDTELTQAIFAIYEIVSVPNPSCPDGFVVNVRESSSLRRFSGQA